MTGKPPESGIGVPEAGFQIEKRAKTVEVAAELLKQHREASARLVALFLKSRPTLKESEIDDATKQEIDVMASEQAAGIIERKEAHRRADNLTKELADLQKKASIDTLTGIYNRRGFEEQANHSLKIAQDFIKKQNQERSSEKRLVNVFLAFDIDKFKNINDQGLREHGEGDAVLIGVGEALQKTMRPTDLVVRFGGDEFGALLLNVPINEVDSVMQRILKALQTVTYKRKDDPENNIPIEVSVGLRLIEADEVINWEGIKSNADETAGLAKMRKDKKGYLVYSQEVKKETIQYLKGELAKPIEETDKFQSLLREHQRHLEDVRDLLSPEQADKVLARLKDQAREELELTLKKMQKKQIKFILKFLLEERLDEIPKQDVSGYRHKEYKVRANWFRSVISQIREAINQGLIKDVAFIEKFTTFSEDYINRKRADENFLTKKENIDQANEIIRLAIEKLQPEN